MHRFNQKALLAGGNYGHCFSDDGLFYYPYIQNLHFYDLKQLRTDDELNGSFFDNFFKKRKGYDEFIYAKSRKPTVDIYGAFQPFNEDFRSLAIHGAASRRSSEWIDDLKPLG